MKTTVITVISIVILFNLFSCQPILRTFLGVKKPQVYETAINRENYYKPFYEGKPYTVKMFTLRDTSQWLPTFQNLHVPRVLLKNNVTDTVYVLSCFEDIAYDVELLNSGKSGKVYKADSLEFSKVQDAFKNIAVKSYTIDEEYNKGDWDAYLLYGTFMGKKIRKRTLPITELNGLRSVYILDVSVDGEK